ncbi:MAG: putative esterase [Flavobacteriales bacterium]
MQGRNSRFVLRTDKVDARLRVTRTIRRTQPFTRPIQIMTQLTQKHSLLVPKTTRYYSLGTVQHLTNTVWFVLHGYGQAAEYFIKHFSALDPEQNVVIAPEGLSRFYIKGLKGRVGASWMTKEDREDEIKDQCEYLNAVAKDAGINLQNPKQKIVLLGFSQGTSTAVRWLLNSGFKADAIVLWAGSFPHDVEPENIADHLVDGGFHYAYGTQDEFLKDINIEEKLAPLADQGLNPTIWTFDGPHAMDRVVLGKISDAINKG